MVSYLRFLPAFSGFFSRILRIGRITKLKYMFLPAFSGFFSRILTYEHPNTFGFGFYPLSAVSSAE